MGGKKMTLKKAGEKEGEDRGYMFFDTLVKRFYRSGAVEVVEVKCDECGNKTFYLKKLSPKHKACAVCTSCSKIVSV
jgi:hypothetical protein